MEIVILLTEEDCGRSLERGNPPWVTNLEGVVLTLVKIIIIFTRWKAVIASGKISSTCS